MNISSEDKVVLLRIGIATSATYTIFHMNDASYVH